MKRLFLFALLMISMQGFSQQVQRFQKGAVPETMFAARIVTLDQVLALPYTKGQGSPYSIMIVPKSSSNVKEVEFVKLRLYQSDKVISAPLTINAWNSLAIVSIDVDNPTLFTNYFVYVGFGQFVEGL